MSNRKNSPRKFILNQLIDIGCVATLNNFYNPNAKTYLGSLVRSREYFKFYLKHSLIKRIEPIDNPVNPCNEVFYCITKKGAKYVGRENEYKYKHIYKSSNITNIMHESVKFDICLAFTRLYPDYLISVDYYTSYGGIRPDATVVLTNKYNDKKKYTFFIEIERKKTIERTYYEKLKRYEEVFNELRKDKRNNKNILPKRYTILVVYANLSYNVFTRPQQLNDNELIQKEVSTVRNLTKELASSLRYGANLPRYRYLFMPLPDFYRLNKPVWFKPTGEITELVK